MLIMRYEVEGGMMPDGKSDMVDYKKFSDQIDKVFTVKGLEKDPRKQVKLALEDVGEPVLGPDNPNISAVESEEVKEVRKLAGIGVQPRPHHAYTALNFLSLPSNPSPP